MRERQPTVFAVSKVAFAARVIPGFWFCYPLQIFPEVDRRLRRGYPKSFDQVFAIHLSAPCQALVKIDQAGEHRRLEGGIVHWVKLYLTQFRVSI